MPMRSSATAAMTWMAQVKTNSQMRTKPRWSALGRTKLDPRMINQNAK